MTIVALFIVHCVSKNDTDIAHYNFNAHQRFRYQMVICYPTSPN